MDGAAGQGRTDKQRALRAVLSVLPAHIESNPKSRVPRALPVGEWLGTSGARPPKVPRALPVVIYYSHKHMWPSRALGTLFFLTREPTEIISGRG